MNLEITRKLITFHGGAREFGRRLGVAEPPNFRKRVDNWLTRGIPIAVQLEKRERLQVLLRQAEKAGAL